MYVADVQYEYGDPMSGGVLELGSCLASTAIISIRSCVCVMRFLVFLTGLDTAESIAFIITHALNITTEYKKQNTYHFS